MDWIPENACDLIDEKFRGWRKKVLAPAIIEAVVRLKEYWPLTVQMASIVMPDDEDFSVDAKI